MFHEVLLCGLISICILFFLGERETKREKKEDKQIVFNP